MHFEAAAHAGKPQPLAIEADTGEFGETETIPPAFAPKPRESCLAVACLGAAKEALERFISNSKSRWISF
jgi:hypothetical protein